MNCANHPDRERTAFCQNCGKPVCTECLRNVGSSTFCEPCLVARVAGTAPLGYGYAGLTPGAPPRSSGEPNPSIAALLGFIPGVGAMYNEQYAKGIVHLIVFALLVSLANTVDMFGLFVAGWEFYMVIEAHHTARARRDGTPLPNPFGLNDIAERLGFGKAWPSAGRYTPPFAGQTPPDAAPFAGQTPPTDPNAPVNAGASQGDRSFPPVNPYAQSYGPYAQPYTYNYTYVPPVSPPEAASYAVPPVPPYSDPSVFHRFPSGAIWLIGLGVLFLIGNTGIFRSLHLLFGPIVLIGLGVWLFVRKMLSTGHGLENDGSEYYRWRLMSALSGSFWMILTGVIWLLNVAHILSWRRSWPIYLIALGLLGVFKRTVVGHYPPLAGPPAVPVPAAETAVAETRLVVHPETSSIAETQAGGDEPGHDDQHSNDQEGR